VTSKYFTQAFIAAKARIQRDPELMDAFLEDVEDLTGILQDVTIQKIFHELTIDVLMTEHSFNWIHIDSAISILDRISDFFHYGRSSTGS
jgi:hypothetical protein